MKKVKKMVALVALLCLGAPSYSAVLPTVTQKLPDLPILHHFQMQNQDMALQESLLEEKRKDVVKETLKEEKRMAERPVMTAAYQKPDLQSVINIVLKYKSIPGSGQ